MIVPTIHLNGSGKTRLVDQLCVAKGAARILLEALSDAAPNARDYYPQGPDAMRAATAEHQARVDKVNSVAKELEELAFAVSQAAR